MNTFTHEGFNTFIWFTDIIDITKFELSRAFFVGFKPAVGKALQYGHQARP
jgi:hypothetical protein